MSEGQELMRDLCRFCESLLDPANAGVPVDQHLRMRADLACCRLLQLRLEDMLKQKSPGEGAMTLLANLLNQLQCAIINTLKKEKDDEV